MARQPLTSIQHDQLRTVIHHVDEYLEQSEKRGDSQATIVNFVHQRLREMTNICDRDIQGN